MLVSKGSNEVNGRTFGVNTSTLTLAPSGMFDVISLSQFGTRAFLVIVTERHSHLS